MNINQINLPHFTFSGMNSQLPCAEHVPTMSPARQRSPHAFPLQPCSEHGFSSALTQNPSPSQTPSPKLGFLQAKPHSTPLHVRTYKVGTKVETKTISIWFKPFHKNQFQGLENDQIMFSYSTSSHTARMHQREHHTLTPHHKVHKSLICLIRMSRLFVLAQSKLKKWIKFFDGYVKRLSWILFRKYIIS